MSTRPILVVDDEAINLATLKQILAPQYTLAFARSGHECLAAAAKHQPALILLDVQMPDLDGYEVCRRLKADPQTEHIPVIFVTALAEVGDEAAGFDCGAVDYIVKPVSPALVLARVRNQLSLVRASMLERYVQQLEAQQLKIGRLSRIKTVLSGINSAIVRLRERQALLDEACRVAAEDGGFAMAWVALAHGPLSTLSPVATRGLDAAQLDRLCLTLSKGVLSPRLALPYRALDEAAAVYSNDLSQADAADAICADARACGFGSAIALPLTPWERPVGVIVLYARDAHLFDDDELKLLGELAGDISFALKHIEQEEKVHYLSRYDALTGLPNNHVFLDHLGLAIQSAASAGRTVVAIVANLARFKRFNDSFGRHVGDQLLRQLGQRLTTEFSRSHSVARVAGDTFALAGPYSGDEGLTALLRTLGEVVGKPVGIDGAEIALDAHFGLAVYPDDGRDAESLFRNAEAALRQARLSGERQATYSPELNARMVEKHEMERQLREALARQQFVLHFQPKVDLDQGCITGAEALIRWQHPGRGLLSPGEFIAVAEETGLIVSIGEWVIQAVCAQQAAWRERGMPTLPVAVNLSALQFREGRVRLCVEQALRDNGLEADAIELELTETLVMQNPGEAERTMQDLRQFGLHLSLDDFGTGYSSLAYLKLFPFNSVKIDRAFVTDVSRGEQDAAIALAIIAMAHSMRMHVIAEGVETQEQLQFLRRAGCDQIQGYYFSRPVPADDYARMLQEGKRLQPTPQLGLMSAPATGLRPRRHGH
ncbi:diguanylate cyclase (GGDEF)-like protein [Pelomonas saccharophila]|uniref:Diguanylate cyclase (GGDEF)-like protein n=1 Tax=Roseateles saccharophilus TaxID=304 RepID=A0ABU1YKE4_ROSSA|nr:EAL domain-containing protein [Roseateles saccharophilus]MDR7268670.1 diguanylate cyclase (GGDEF)-like protein [Roseateles saccharophilus]